MKDKFILNYENLTKLCDDILIKFPKVKLKIEKSPNKMSNSFYLRFYLCNVSTSLRISDHNTRLTDIGGGIRNIVVDKTTTDGMIMNKIYEAIYALQRKLSRVHIEELYDKIKDLKGKQK